MIFPDQPTIPGHLSSLETLRGEDEKEKRENLNRRSPMIFPDQPTIPGHLSSLETLRGEDEEEKRENLFSSLETLRGEDEEEKRENLAQGAVPCGRYEIREILGCGGMGEVLKIYDRDLGREVALKRMLGKFSNDPAAIEEFVNEAKITGNLEHPNIIPIYDVNTDENGQLFYVMRLMRGISLRQVIQGLRNGNSDICKKYTLQHLLRNFMQIYNALALAHTHGIIHRDLKPENIMFGEYGDVMLVDWGIAVEYQRKKCVPDSGNTKMTGTLGYMAPEQIENDLSRMGPHTDIYALGAMLFETVSLRRPVAASQTLKIMGATLQGNLQFLDDLVPGVPCELVKITEKCLALAPEDRYRNCQDLADDLGCFLDQLPLKHIHMPLSHRMLRLYTGRQEFIKKMTPMDVEFFAYVGFLLGVFACSMWPGLAAYGKYCLIAALTLAMRPLWVMIFAGYEDKFSWFIRLQGKFPDLP